MINVKRINLIYDSAWPNGWCSTRNIRQLISFRVRKVIFYTVFLGSIAGPLIHSKAAFAQSSGASPDGTKKALSSPRTQKQSEPAMPTKEQLRLGRETRKRVHEIIQRNYEACGYSNACIDKTVSEINNMPNPPTKALAHANYGRGGNLISYTIQSGGMGDYSLPQPVKVKQSEK